MSVATSRVPHASPVRLLVVDQRPVYSRALEALFERCAAIEVIGDKRHSASFACVSHADVVLMSGVSPRTGALALLARIRIENPRAATLMLLDDVTPAFITSAHAAGVRGMLLEGVTAQELLSAVIAIHAGEKVFDPGLAPAQRAARFVLSDRELDVLKLVAEGASPHAVSRALNISKSTTRTYLTGAIRKLGAQNRADAARTARQLGWF